MSKRKSKKTRGDQGNQSAHSEAAQPEPAERALVVSDAANSLAWPRSIRLIVSLAILCYLAVVLLGPLSNPIASQYFSAPIANAISPIHRAMFLATVTDFLHRNQDLVTFSSIAEFALTVLVSRGSFLTLKTIRLGCFIIAGLCSAKRFLMSRYVSPPPPRLNQEAMNMLVSLNT